MIVSIEHRFTLLSTPKCGTTALTRAMKDKAEIAIIGTREGKHMPFQNYLRVMTPRIEALGGDIAAQEVLCLMREPLSYVRSWWSYRRRDEIRGKPRSTAGIGFDEFLEAYLEDYRNGESTRTGVGSQSRMAAADQDGEIGVDRLFRYEEFDRVVAWIEARTGWSLNVRRLNVSPPVSEEGALSADLTARARDVLAPEYALYARATGEPLSPAWRSRAATVSG